MEDGLGVQWVGQLALHLASNKEACFARIELIAIKINVFLPAYIKRDNSNVLVSEILWPLNELIGRTST